MAFVSNCLHTEPPLRVRLYSGFFEQLNDDRASYNTNTTSYVYNINTTSYGFSFSTLFPIPNGYKKIKLISKSYDNFTMETVVRVHVPNNPTVELNKKGQTVNITNGSNIQVFDTVLSKEKSRYRPGSALIELYK